MKVDVIIPVYRPGARFLEMLRRLSKQTRPVNRFIIMNTEKTRYCSGSTKERASCQEEKMGCVGCNYYTKKIPHKPEKGIIRLWK